MERLDLREDRYHRQSLIAWWDQQRVRNTRVLVIGAGALGNEILKLLALTGCGYTLVYDPDRIERSNLSRTVLFRETDEGHGKAEVAVRRMREINADVHAHAFCENVLVSGGLGVFAWADVVIGAVDSREARVFINSACARVGKQWVDGAIEALSGVVRVFDPARGACYECTMNKTDRKLLAERRSCAMLAREAVTRGHVPTSAVAASIIGAMEVQEAIKVVHGQPTLVGEGLHVDGLFGEATRVRYPRRDDCQGHEHLGEIVRTGLGRDTKLGQLLARAEEMFGAGASIDFSRDLITRLTCPSCGETSRVGAALGAIRESQAACPACQAHRVVEIASTVSRGDGGLDLDLTLGELGVPAFDIVVARQGMDRQQAWLLDADAEHVLGPLAESWKQGNT